MSRLVMSAKSDYVLACMMHRERACWRKTKLIAWLAAPGVIIDALFLSAVVWMVCTAIMYSWGVHQYEMSWTASLILGVPLSVPLFWWLDVRTHKSDILEDAVGDGPPMMLSMGFGLGAFGTAGGILRGIPIFRDLLLMGPRQLRRALNRYQAANRFDAVCRDRAELALRQMIAVNHSCYTHKLLRKSEEMQSLAPAMAYLIFYDWISTSKDTLYVWLSGEARKTLEAAVRDQCS